MKGSGDVPEFPAKTPILLSVIEWLKLPTENDVSPSREQYPLQTAPDLMTCNQMGALVAGIGTLIYDRALWSRLLCEVRLRSPLTCDQT